MLKIICLAPTWSRQRNYPLPLNRLDKELEDYTGK